MFTNTMRMPRLATIGVVLGGVAGWVSHEFAQRYSKKQKCNQLSRYHLQKALAYPWNKQYEPQPWNSNWDNLSPLPVAQGKQLVDENNNPIATKKPTASRHIFLIRHGQYNLKGNEDEYHTLTDLGLQQADLAGKRLSHLGFPFSKMIVSTMTRARETADAIGKHLPVDVEKSTTDLLREGSPFPPEPSLSNWRPDEKQFLADGDRIEKGFVNFFHRASPDQKVDSYELIICHANVIRYLVCRALQLPPEAWLRISLNHASITWLTIRPSGRVTLRMLGDSGFMPNNMLTTS